jgi:NADH-quinone oxidoreductase subunit L
MAGEQDMRRMGGLKKFLPVTYITMLIGTLAIAGIPPLSGFFSKDEILFRTFLGNKLVWGLAVITALMTAFYMFRLMAMTFLGAYHGPAWEGTGDPHGPAHRPHDAHATHGAASHAVPDDATAHGHGHGAWHGPHESPRTMTVPLMALAIGAIVAGFVGVPAALGGSNAIEHFLEPSFTAHATAERAERTAEPASQAAAEAGAGHAEEPHMSQLGELGLMALSVGIGVLGIALAYRFYVTHPEISEQLATRWAGAHAVLSNKYYVDELYDATFVKGTMSSARGLWTFDGRVVDGAVNGSGWLTVFSSWISHLFDKYIVDGLVNLVGWTTGESSFFVRWLQTGLVQTYALWMLGGVFVFMTVYLLMM